MSPAPRDFRLAGTWSTFRLEYSPGRQQPWTLWEKRVTDMQSYVLCFAVTDKEAVHYASLRRGGFDGE